MFSLILHWFSPNIILIRRIFVFYQELPKIILKALKPTERQRPEKKTEQKEDSWSKFISRIRFKFVLSLSFAFFSYNSPVWNN